MNHLIHYANAVEKSTKSKPKVRVIGLPRAMTYYEHGKLWENFFSLLGCDVIVSPQTNRRILDAGVSHCSNETCLPVKVLAGHVLELKGKADAIFIPRCKSVAAHELCCPKLCALPDMMRMGIDGVDIIEVDIDFDKGQAVTQKTLAQLAGRIGKTENETAAAFDRAVKNRLHAGIKARLGADMEAGTLTGEKTVAVLGHPYMIYDRFLSMNLLGRLRAQGLNVITPDSFSYETRKMFADPFLNRNFYDIGRDNLGGAFAGEALPEVAGIVYLTPFSCGVDSLVTEFIGRHNSGRNMPLLVLTIDEHTGEAGVETRLEAFTDML